MNSVLSGNFAGCRYCSYIVTMNSNWSQIISEWSNHYLNYNHHKDLENPGIMGYLDSSQLKLWKRQGSSSLLTLTVLIGEATTEQDL